MLFNLWIYLWNVCSAIGPKSIAKTISTSFFLYFSIILPAIAFGNLQVRHRLFLPFNHEWNSKTKLLNTGLPTMYGTVKTTWNSSNIAITSRNKVFEMIWKKNIKLQGIMNIQNLTDRLNSVQSSIKCFFAL